MAELDVRSRQGRNVSRVRVQNLGPETVIISKIVATDGDDSFFVGEPLDRELELRKLSQPHEFMVAPGLSHGRPLYIDITFTDASGMRTKTYPVYV